MKRVLRWILIVFGAVFGAVFAINVLFLAYMNFGNPFKRVSQRRAVSRQMKYLKEQCETLDYDTDYCPACRLTEFVGYAKLSITNYEKLRGQLVDSGWTLDPLMDSEPTFPLSHRPLKGYEEHEDLYMETWTCEAFPKPHNGYAYITVSKDYYYAYFYIWGSSNK